MLSATSLVGIAAELGRGFLVLVTVLTDELARDVRGVIRERRNR